MSDHTPGPWAVFRPGRWGHEGIYDWTVVSVARDRAICDGDGDNAQLIAAAPDLLEALEELMACKQGEFCEQYPAAYKKAQAAIAKARGEA